MKHPDPQHKRIIHVYRNNKWEVDGLENVNRGDVYRAFESDGTPVPMIENTDNYDGLALYDSFIAENGRNQVDTVPISEILERNETNEQVLLMYPLPR